MKVRLVSYSRPTTEFEMENVHDMHDLISYCARVSNPSNQSNTKTSKKLLKYMVDNAHWSPFEMVSACIELTTTRDIGRQFLRHRSFSFQEFSQRYADPTKDFEFVLREARMQDTKNRQNSTPLDLNTDDGRRLAWMWEAYQNRVIDQAKEAYQWAVDNGIAKECARAVLPEGNTVSRMYANGTIRSWMHYIQLRGANGTQKEHMDIALACAQAITAAFPMISDSVPQ